jgi:hypothetical protein
MTCTLSTLPEMQVLTPIAWRQVEDWFDHDECLIHSSEILSWPQLNFGSRDICSIFISRAEKRLVTTMRSHSRVGESHYCRYGSEDVRRG